MSLNRCWARLNYLSKRSLSVRNLVNTCNNSTASAASLESRGGGFASLGCTSHASCLTSLIYVFPPERNCCNNITLTTPPPPKKIIQFPSCAERWVEIFNCRLWSIVSVWLCSAKLPYSALDSWGEKSRYFATIALFHAARSTFKQQLEIGNI